MSQEGYVAERKGMDLSALEAVTNAFPPHSFYILWRVNDITDVLQGLPQRIEEWEGGRLFSAQWELRWRKRAHGKYDLLSLREADSPPLPGFDKGEAYVVVFSHESQEKRVGLYLWGARDRGSASDVPWVETRIPRTLRYPKVFKLPPEREGQKREFAAIKYCEYRTRKEGVVSFIRLRGW